MHWMSTDAIADSVRLLPFVANMKQELNLSKLPGEWARQEDDKSKRFSDLEDWLMSGLPDWSGQLTIAIGGESEGWSGGLELLRVPMPGKEGVSGRAAGYRNHTVTVELSNAAMKFTSFLENRTLDFLAHSAITLGADLAIGSDDDGFFRELHAVHGLESGIPGVYQAMVLGPAFTGIILNDRLKKLKVEKSLWKNKHWYAFQISESQKAPGNTRDEIKRDIGLEYFSTPASSRSMPQGGEFGLFDFAFRLLRSKHEYESKSNQAAQCPKIDWSGVFENKSSGGFNFDSQHR